MVSQNANWGTGLPVTINGSFLDLSVFDPILNQTKTTSLYVGSNAIYTNNDGVVVGYGGTGNMQYATYDIELHSWEYSSDQLSSTSGATAMILTAE